MRTPSTAGRPSSASSPPARLLSVPGNIWHARCAYIRTLPPLPELARRLLAVPPPSPCSPWFAGTRQAVPEHWPVSRPSAIITDVLPLAAARGRPVLYAWGYENLPLPDSWQPRPERFPRPGLPAGLFLQASRSYAPHLACSLPSFRAAQLRAVYGPAALAAAPCAGAAAAWLALAAGTLNASAPEERAYVDDALNLSEAEGVRSRCRQPRRGPIGGD